MTTNKETNPYECGNAVPSSSAYYETPKTRIFGGLALTAICGPTSVGAVLLSLLPIARSLGVEVNPVAVVAVSGSAIILGIPLLFITLVVFFAPVLLIWRDRVHRCRLFHIVLVSQGVACAAALLLTFLIFGNSWTSPSVLMLFQWQLLFMPGGFTGGLVFWLAVVRRVGNPVDRPLH